MMRDGLGKIIPLFLIILLSGIVYFNALGNGFHFDDSHHIVDNPYLKGIEHIPALFTDTRTFSVWEGNSRHYRPLLLLTYSLNYIIGGLNPVGYHLVNLAFHAGSAFLVFLIINAMLGGEWGTVGARNNEWGTSGVRNDGSGFFVALTAALIFAVHPFSSEVVNYISTRSSVMSAFFYLLAFYCWVKYRTPPPSPPPRGGRVGKGRGFYIASLIAFLLGMLTKEIVIPLPIVLWLYDLYFVPVQGGQDNSLSLRERVVSYLKRIPVYLPFLFFVALPYIVLRGILVSRSGGTPFAVLPRSYYENLLMETKVPVKYIYLWLVPSRLSVEHEVGWAFNFLDGYVVMSTAFIVSLLALAVWLYRRDKGVYRLVSFFIMWYFIVLSPLMVLPLNAVLQENRGYLAGVFLSVTGGVIIGSGSRLFPNLHRWVGISVLAVILIFYSAVSIERNRVWKDDLTLWADAVGKSPLSARAHHYLALTYYRMGRTGPAIVEYQKALSLDDSVHRAQIHNNLGSLYGELGLWDLAVYEFKIAIEINPRFYKAYNNLGTVYMVKGDLDGAARKYREAIRVYPGYREARVNLEKVYEKSKLNRK